MKKKFLALALLLTSTAFLFSCKKDEDNQLQFGLLTKASWKQIKTETDFGTGTYEEFPLEDCSKDDLTTFDIGYHYTTNVGIRCDATDPEETDDNGTWALSADGHTLTLTSATGFTYKPATIESLDENKLVLSVSQSVGCFTTKYRNTHTH